MVLIVATTRVSSLKQGTKSDRSTSWVISGSGTGSNDGFKVSEQTPSEEPKEA
jgi:hypothetical protein